MAQKLKHSFQLLNIVGKPKASIRQAKQSITQILFQEKKRNFAIQEGEEEAILGWLAVAGAIWEWRPLMDKMN